MLYKVKSVKKLPGFASAWDDQNMDLPDFLIFQAAKN